MKKQKTPEYIKRYEGIQQALESIMKVVSRPTISEPFPRADMDDSGLFARRCWSLFWLVGRISKLQGAYPQMFKGAVNVRNTKQDAMPPRVETLIGTTMESYQASWEHFDAAKEFFCSVFRRVLVENNSK